jgi:hypothetical protein
MSKVRFPATSEVVRHLKAINRELETPTESEWGGEEPGIEVRLQVRDDGGWAVHFGDPQYDSDHRGFWGSSEVPGSGKKFAAKEVARHLIADAQEHAAEKGFDVAIRARRSKHARSR